MSPKLEHPGQSILRHLPVVFARDFQVSDGANLGDALSIGEDIMADDTYQVFSDTRGALDLLSFVSAETADDAGGAEPGTRPDFVIAPGSLDGEAGNWVFLDCALTFMSPDGTTSDALVLVEVMPETGEIAAIYLLPSAPATLKTDYRVVGVDTENAAQVFARFVCTSFTRGTNITMGNGAQRAIETLEIGDVVLTRDSGPQKIAWIGASTQRAVGEFAPIRIQKSVLNNAEDLLVSPNHRLFFWQRNDALNLGRSEVLIQARHLENGDTIRREEGGFVDYFQLLFDAHQIVFAEGIATESMLLNRTTSPALSGAAARGIARRIANHGAGGHADFEITRDDLEGRDFARDLGNAPRRQPS